MSGSDLFMFCGICFHPLKSHMSIGVPSPEDAIVMTRLSGKETSGWQQRERTRNINLLILEKRLLRHNK